MMSSDGDLNKSATCRALWIRRRRTKKNYQGLRVSLATTRGEPCQQGDNSVGGAQITMPVFKLDKLPEDTLQHVHSLLPLRDAARAACVSHKFLRSWRCFPNLTFTQETLGLNAHEGTPYERAEKFIERVNHVLQNHSGIGVKTLKFEIFPCQNVITADHLDIWLRDTIKSGVLDIAVKVPHLRKLKYNLSCAILSTARSSLQFISLFSCAFHPTLSIGYLKNLKRLSLTFVDITGEDLGCLFSCTILLENLEVSSCDEITFLNVPSHLQNFCTLQVSMCHKLRMVEIYAPKLTTFLFRGPPIQIIVHDSSQLKYMVMHCSYYSGMFQYAQTYLHSITSNLQTLTLSSSNEEFYAPLLPAKFLQLRLLNIYFRGRGFQRYDYLSLASFLEACPSLESFFLSAGECYNVGQQAIQDSNADSSNIRRIPEFSHANLKKVYVERFCSTKSLIELTCQIIENTSSLQSLVLDTSHGFDPRGMCKNMRKEDVIQALSAVEAIKSHIEGKVPSSTKFKVWEPCSRCHIAKL